jgi:hypothetical protein
MKYVAMGNLEKINEFLISVDKKSLTTEEFHKIKDDQELQFNGIITA